MAEMLSLSGCGWQLLCGGSQPFLVSLGVGAIGHSFGLTQLLPISTCRISVVRNHMRKPEPVTITNRVQWESNSKTR